MAMGREGDPQGDLIVTWAEMPNSPGHVFYDRLQEVLIAGGFDGFVETTCQPYYAPKMGAPSVPPGRDFRMHMVGYFERIASARYCLAVFGFDVAARFSTAREPGEGSRSLVGCRRPACGFRTKSTRRCSTVGAGSRERA
jgi:hypothetical protein